MQDGKRTSLPEDLPSLSRGGLLRVVRTLYHLPSWIRLVGRLMKDRRMPLWLKALPILAVIYVVSPFDFIPDFIPGIGVLDDVGILLLALSTFFRLAPSDVIEEHVRALSER